MAKSTTKPSTEVALASQFTLDKVPDMLEQVNAKIKALKGDNDRAAKITESLGVFGKISDIKDSGKLIDAYAFITRKAAAHAEFAPVFQEIDQLSKPKEFRESGHTLKAWQDEITSCYRAAIFESQLAKLEKAKALLTENLSTEQKFQASMQDLAEVLGLGS